MADKKEFSPLQLAAFPKQCLSCDRIYASEEQFFADTTPVNEVPANLDSVPQSHGDSSIYLRVFRRCGCGAILVKLLRSRRDCSEQGLTRRQLFDSMLAILREAGHDRGDARAILLQQLPAFKDS